MPFSWRLGGCVGPGIPLVSWAPWSVSVPFSRAQLWS